MSKHVGDISFNEKLDDSSFKVCDETKILQYYSVNANYQNGRKALMKEIWDTIEPLSFKASGYITFRFIINCEGDIGYFRVKTIDSELKKNVFDSDKIKRLQMYIENLKHWNAGALGAKTFDSYFVLNFKIETGKITDIF
ncbi:hypothetical protein OAD49_00570 [Flavobacteriaceae bacterium]|nr:hypothetical protein [Flavobacteriaceae bacterium]